MDNFGALQLPLDVQTDQVAVGDPVLRYLPAYLAAVLQYDLGEAWRVISPGAQLADHVFRHDPGRMFDESRLPALYCWELRASMQRVADDVLLSERTIVICWCAAFDQPHKEELREPFVNALQKCLYRSIRRERHPAWVATGDTDPLSGTRGTNVAHLCGFTRAQRITGQPVSFDMRLTDAEHQLIQIRGVRMELEIREYCELGSDTAYASALDATVTVNGGAFSVEQTHGL